MIPSAKEFGMVALGTVAGMAILSRAEDWSPVVKSVLKGNQNNG